MENVNIDLLIGIGSAILTFILGLIARYFVVQSQCRLRRSGSIGGDAPTTSPEPDYTEPPPSQNRRVRVLRRMRASSPASLVTEDPLVYHQNPMTVTHHMSIPAVLEHNSERRNTDPLVIPHGLIGPLSVIVDAVDSVIVTRRPLSVNTALHRVEVSLQPLPPTSPHALSSVVTLEGTS